MPAAAVEALSQQLAAEALPQCRWMAPVAAAPAPALLLVHSMPASAQLPLFAPATLGQKLRCLVSKPS